MDRCLILSLSVLAPLALGACDEEPERAPSPELADTEWDDSSAASDGDDSDDDTDDDSDDSRGSSNDDSSDDSTGGDDSDDSRGSDSDDSGTDGDDSGSRPPAQGDCEPTALNLAGGGFVSASSVFDTLLGPPFPAELAIDGDPGTSWFSKGPEEDGDTSTLEWFVMRDHCIDEITIVGNGNHQNSDFHELFGFNSVTITVFDTSGSEVLREDFELEGTPDPTVTLEGGGVLAHRVLLEFHGHEAPDCGGFAELEITGRAQKEQ